MSRKARQAQVPRIEQVRQQIEQWRRERPHLGRMPEPLWEAAVEVARAHGIYAASQGLRVSYDSIKTRLAQGRSRPRPAKPVPAKPVPAMGFVEIVGGVPATGAPSGTSVELTRSDGTKLAVHLRIGESVDLVQLAREFWGGAA
jgi:hypothetical protein